MRPERVRGSRNAVSILGAFVGATVLIAGLVCLASVIVLIVNVNMWGSNK